MKEKLLALKDNIVISFEYIKEYPKRAALIFVLACCLVYGTFVGLTDRAPAAVKCWYKASFVGSIQSEKWRFNWIPANWNDQCQRQRSDGTWIPVEKVTDVGIDTTEDLEDM